MSLRLALLVAGTTLPLILFAAGVVYVDYRADREASFERVLETVRGIRLVLDREAQGITSGLQVLALSPSLQRDDIKAFRQEVETFLAQYPSAMAISLADSTGRQLLNSLRPEGTPLPQRANLASVQRVFETGQTIISSAFRGSVSGRLVLTAEVPVRREGRVIYALASTLPIQGFQTIIEQQRPSESWTIAIFDASGVNFARVPNPEQTVGRSASPTLLAALFKQPEAKLLTTSLEGVELITAFTRSSISGWTVAAGMPTSVLEAPLWRALAVTAAIGIVLLGIGLAFAVHMATRIARAEALHELLINELNHRVKNTLATIQSLSAQTFRGVSDPAEARSKFDARLMALSRAHNVLSAERWEKADLREIVEEAVVPYSTQDVSRLELQGPPVPISPSCALMMSMVLHELATNAVKYGSLSVDTGRVQVRWSRIEGAPPRLHLEWRERGGPKVQPPERRGFGSSLVERAFPSQLKGSAAVKFDPEGVRCSIECPLE